MRKLLNIYIILFILDAVLSVGSSISDELFGEQPLHLFQQLIAYTVVLLSIPLYFMVGCIKNFPKRIVLPMILFSSWVSTFLALPLPIYLGMDNLFFFLSIFQLILGVGLLFILRKQQKRWLYSPSITEQLSFRWKRLVAFIGANIILLPPLIAIYLGISLSLGLSHHSSGFIRLSPKGIILEARTYQYKEKQIHLLPTVHIARSAFYDDLVAPLPNEKIVMIPEGVTDTNKLLRSKIGKTYKNLAKKTKLESQNNESLTKQRPIVLCDVDVSQFSPETIKAINSTFKIYNYMLNDQYRQALLMIFTTQEPDAQVFSYDLLIRRNKQVIGCINGQLNSYEHIAVPWGAAHMPGIEKMLIDLGAKVTETRDLFVFKWL